MKSSSVLLLLIVCLAVSTVLSSQKISIRQQRTTNNENQAYDDLQALKFLKESYESGLIEEDEYRVRKSAILDRVTGPISSSSSTGNWNSTYNYNQQINWLLQQFQNGLPRSYDDVLPNGDNFWTTAAYLDIGAIDPFGNPVPLDSQIAIQERTLTRYGLNLYDGATWEIALALSGLGAVAEIYENTVLYTSSTGANPQIGGIIDIRGDTSFYSYGPKGVNGPDLTLVALPGNVSRVPSDGNGNPEKQSVKNIPGAYFYRMIGPNYSMNDPYLGYYAWTWQYPWPNNDSTTTWNIFGEIHWNDWKPITGENVWGTMIGPLQRMWIQNNTNITDFTTFEDAPPAVQLGLSILPALSNMQSPLGSLYHCPKGTNMFPPDPNEAENVSNENNFSAYAATMMLLEVLQNKTTGTSDPILTSAITTLTQITTNLEKWFATYLLSEEGVVYQGGHVSFAGQWEPLLINSSAGGFAVDCQTWGMTVLGQQFVDQNYGAGTAYNVWQKTKQLAGYYLPNGSLGGVGYTNDTAVNATQIWSAEWTFGAINMCNKLAYEYSLIGETDYSESLLADALSMEQALWQQAERDQDDRWIGGGLLQADGSFVYANARFFIPWGWYANPIGSLCSTSWGVMNRHGRFNPFKIGGGFVSGITGK
eukprot:TRINITY_DN1133_c0_g1_i2.p1 TRINITY_DN1133_c0_g1~~TRINITY_DN1133_c0_g1_i2.p1  ORF type:complete len:648 (+),score=165.19 TRINITY_DN1133_c0_g1_i2:65-2008(+)